MNRLFSALVFLSTVVPAASIQAGQGYALAIGLNRVDPAHYHGNPGILEPCENDARDMLAIAKKEGFVETRLLLTKEATRAAVTSALDQLAVKLQAEDALVVSYSGHGGTIKDDNGDEEDGMDETWCLYDGELIDDDLARQWAKFKPGVRICVYSDSCHSGTVTKQLFVIAQLRAQLASKELPPARIQGMKELVDGASSGIDEGTAKRLIDQLKALNLPILKPPAKPKAQDNIQATVILFAAVQDAQLADANTPNSVFTAALKKTWNDGAFSGSHPDFFKALCATLKPSPSNVPNYSVIGTENKAFEAQRPWTH